MKLKNYIKKIISVILSIFIIMISLTYSSFQHKNSSTKIYYHINCKTPLIATSPIKGNITSGFGYRIHPISYNLDFHPAIDISSPNKTPIKSILPGKIKKTGYSNIYGNYIIISHNNNIESKYCHCQKILKKQGSKVKKGQTISTVGHTGLVTGNHLHLEIKVNNIYIDPLLIIKNKS